MSPILEKSWLVSDSSEDKKVLLKKYFLFLFNRTYTMLLFKKNCHVKSNSCGDLIDDMED